MKFLTMDWTDDYAIVGTNMPNVTCPRCGVPVTDLHECGAVAPVPKSKRRKKKENPNGR